MSGDVLSWVRHASLRSRAGSCVRDSGSQWVAFTAYLLVDSPKADRALDALRVRAFGHSRVILRSKPRLEPVLSISTRSMRWRQIPSSATPHHPPDSTAIEK
ncbi:MAG: hypothetical protein P8182_03615 [Deltaproteobacteria bacterium]